MTENSFVLRQCVVQLFSERTQVVLNLNGKKGNNEEKAEFERSSKLLR